MEVQYVALELLPKAIGKLEAMLMILQNLESCNKQFLINNLEQISHLMHKSKEALEYPAIGAKAFDNIIKSP